jgi:hypothetical protein
MIITMRFLLAFGGVIASVLAQAVPQFNTVPVNVTAGLDYSISWVGGDGSVSWRSSKI